MNTEKIEKLREDMEKAMQEVMTKNGVEYVDATLSLGIETALPRLAKNIFIIEFELTPMNTIYNLVVKYELTD